MMVFSRQQQNSTTRRHWRFIPHVVGCIVVVALHFYGSPRVDISRRSETVPLSTSCNVTFWDSKMALCHYLAYGKNFGDELGIAVSKKLLQNHFHCSADNVAVINLQSQKRTGRQCLFNLGSIFDQIQSNDHVWGTGINPKWMHLMNRPLNVTIHAVRGLLTLEKIKAKPLNLVTDEEVESVSIGDPGTALIHLFPEIQWKGNGSYCFVPHHQDQEIFQISLHSSHLKERVRMVSVRDSWPNVIELLSSCSYVASSSLHGLVVSDALGIPNAWFQWSGSQTQKTEGWFKYNDYFTTVERASAQPVHDIDQLVNNEIYSSPPEKDVLDRIINQIKMSFPYHLFQAG